MKSVGLPSEVCAMLGICDVDCIAEALDDAGEDPNIDTIVLDFDSPGGEVMGIYEVAKCVEELGTSKTVIGYSSGYCCSAAYWLAAKCNELYVSPSSIIGHIGCACERYDASEQLKTDNVKIAFIGSSPRKFWFNPDYPMSAEEATYITNDVNRQAALFKSEVLANRDIKPECMDAMIYDGQSAVSNNLADGNINSLDILLESLAESQ